MLLFFYKIDTLNKRDKGHLEQEGNSRKKKDFGVHQPTAIGLRGNLGHPPPTK